MEKFAKENYKTYILIDFYKAPAEIKELFDVYLDDLDMLFIRLSNYYDTKLYKRKSLIIFDEVEFCPRARSAIKYLVADGRYDYIETGSLISIKENVKDILIPSEERHIEMYPMDFEEFLIAKTKVSSRHNISPIEVKSGKNYTLSSLNKFKNKYGKYLNTPYVLHTKDLKEENGIIYLPLYMTHLL